ncbi:MAG: endonuclease/exonuclease/phosphatase family protein [Anaerolineae bacterium]
MIDQSYSRDASPLLILSWIYAAIIFLWFLLHGWFGDILWWLALLNAFVPLFFLPLVLLIPVCFVYRDRRYWRSVLVPLVIFLFLYGELLLPNAPVRAGDPMTVMTFNIWGGSQSSETARVIVENGSPDLVALQEVTPDMAGVLLEEIGDLYPYRLLAAEGTYRGMAVLSRFPLTEIETPHLAHPWWEVQVMRVEADAGAFILYNVHPHATNILVYIEEGTAMAAEVRSSMAIRQQLVETLVTDFSHRDGPIVVVGDFNSTDQSDVYALMQKHLIDAYRASGWGFGHTFPAYAGSFRGIPIFPLQMRLDMVFISEDFRATRAWVSRTYGESDHRPLLTELVWR